MEWYIWTRYNLEANDALDVYMCNEDMVISFADKETEKVYY